MKKVFLSLAMGLFFAMSISAGNNYPDDDVVKISKTKEATSSIDQIGIYGLGFYSYDGAENYGLTVGFYHFDGFGFNLNIRSNWKFKDHQNTYNADLLLNYSIGFYNNDDVAILLTPEIGPSIATRDVYDGGKFKEKWFCDGFAGIKATVKYKAVVLSAGYHIWAPKWKFGKDEKADGFYAQLGIDF